MANALYNSWLDLILEAGVGEAALDLTAQTLKAAVVDSSYTFSQTHDFWDDVEADVVGTPQAIGSITRAGGILDGAHVAYAALTGNEVESIVVYMDSGTSSTSRLVAYLDTGITGIPFTPSGADANVAWDAAGIFDLQA